MADGESVESRVSLDFSRLMRRRAVCDGVWQMRDLLTCLLVHVMVCSTVAMHAGELVRAFYRLVVAWSAVAAPLRVDGESAYGFGPLDSFFANTSV